MDVGPQGLGFFKSMYVRINFLDVQTNDNINTSLICSPLSSLMDIEGEQLTCYKKGRTDTQYNDTIGTLARKTIIYDT